MLSPHIKETMYTDQSRKQIMIPTVMHYHNDCSGFRSPFYWSL